MDQELISIIVPIFNTEKYLHQCLDSILSQSYGNFECLLINDGSTDASASICREYVAKDARFRYFEKENGGVSSARNLGIERSGGAYITFIDSDDWVEFDYLEVLYSAIIQETGIWFNESTHLGEDMEFWFKLYLVAEKVVFSNRDTYIYRKNFTTSKYATLKHIRSDMQQRLNFIAFLRAKGMNTNNFVNSLEVELHHIKTNLELDQFEHREVIGYIEEVLLLLEVNINP